MNDRPVVQIDDYRPGLKQVEIEARRSLDNSRARREPEGISLLARVGIGLLTAACAVLFVIMLVALFSPPGAH